MGNIRKPSKELVKEYLYRWENDEEFINTKENTLKKLFSNYKENKEIDIILIKVAVLDSFYSTNLRYKVNMVDVAKCIKELNIDKCLDEGDINLVNVISKGLINSYKNKPKTYSVGLYSFTTKYCSFHRPEFYPIYDSFVEKVLIYFRDNDDLCSFKNKDLKDYKSFKNIINLFIEKYGLKEFDYKKIDQFLWLFGKYELSEKDEN